jgi:hypothetical protein
MENDSPNTLGGDDTAPAFTPVPLLRRRHDGWTPEKQLAFIRVLTATGQVSVACRAVGMSRKSAYALRERADAESFADAWEYALFLGQQRMLTELMERAINGVTTIMVRRGGVIEIGHGPDGRLTSGFLKSPEAGEDRFGGGAASKGNLR